MPLNLGDKKLTAPSMAIVQFGCFTLKRSSVHCMDHKKIKEIALS